VFDDLASIFHKNLLLSYQEYTTHRDRITPGLDGHLRSALNLATALFHFREHLPPNHQITRTQVEQDCPDYQLVADVANASKHGTLTHRTPLVLSATDIQEMAVVVRYADQDGEYADARTVVQVRCSDGSTRNLDTALTSVLNYWGGKLKDWGILDFTPRMPREPPGVSHVRREDATPLNFEIDRGWAWRQKIQFLQFDAAKGRAEPINLSGSKLVFSAYTPKYEAALEVKHPVTGEPIQVDMPLSEEEHSRLHTLGDTPEGQSYLKSLVQSHQVEIQQALSEAVKKSVTSSPMPPQEL
jgi:hypothetical protein